MLNNSHEFSVIIATKHRPKDLQRCIQSVADQTCPPHEVIIVDDGDLTTNTVNELKALLPDQTDFILTESDGPPGLATARNTGMDIASGTIYVGLDDDAIIGETYLEQLQELYQVADDSVAGVGGFDDQTRALSTVERYFKKLFGHPLCWNINSVGIQGFDGGITETVEGDWLPGYNWSYKATVADHFDFPHNNGGREALEDVGYGWQLKNQGYKTLISPELPVTHYEESDGEGAYVTGLKNGENRVKYFRDYGSQCLWPVFLWSMIGVILKLLITPFLGGPKTAPKKAQGIVEGLTGQL